MEEDIKYLEDLLAVAKMLLTTSQKATIQEREIQAIENLIKGYKDLEKRYTIRKEIYDRDIKAVDEKWKSKVREKIEALDDIESEYSKKILNISKETATFTIFVQEILKQLLQEGDK